MHIRHPAVTLAQPSGLASSGAGPGSDPGATVALTAAAAMTLVAGWTELSPARRRDLTSALRSVARMLGLPAGAVILTPGILRQELLRRSPAAYGISESRMRNIRASLRFVLRRAGIIDPAQAPLSPDWLALLDLQGGRPRLGMIGFARFCSQRQVAPEAVDAATLAAFEAQLAARTLTTQPRKLAGRVRGQWNRASARLPGQRARAIGSAPRHRRPSVIGSRA